MYGLTLWFLVCQKIGRYRRTGYEAPVVGQLQAVGGGSPKSEPLSMANTRGQASNTFLISRQRTKAGELLIRPSASESEWYRWLETIQDWCISRQLWWGHRVPAYYVKVEGKPEDVRMLCLRANSPYVSRCALLTQRTIDENWVVGRTVEEATERAKVVAKGAAFSLEQDEDVLDTWFSSGLWPFSINGWPEKV
jgi:valyl-tRNA synthetase